MRVARVLPRCRGEVDVQGLGACVLRWRCQGVVLALGCLGRGRFFVRPSEPFLSALSHPSFWGLGSEHDQVLFVPVSFVLTSASAAMKTWTHDGARTSLHRLKEA